MQRERLVRRKLTYLLPQSVKLGGGHDLRTAVEAHGDIKALAELLSVFGRQNNSALAVYAVIAVA